MKGESGNEYVALAATLKGKHVRIVISLKEFEIVTRDNEESFDPEIYALKLKGLRVEDIY